MPDRPALHAVVEALSGGRVGDVLAVTPRHVVVSRNFGDRERARSWLYSDPAGAYEALVARGLAPPPDGRRRWRWTAGADLPAARGCGACEGEGWCPQWHLGTNPPCDRCNPGGLPSRGATVDTDTPPCLPALVAVASLGLGRWLRAEELAREASPRDVSWYAAPGGARPGPRMPWSPPLGGPAERVDVALREIGVYRLRERGHGAGPTVLVVREL